MTFLPPVLFLLSRYASLWVPAWWMAGSLFSSSRFLYLWFSLVIVRVTDLGYRHLHHPSCDPVSVNSWGSPSSYGNTRPRRLRDRLHHVFCSSRSIYVDHRQGSAARVELHGLLSPFPVSMHLRHARYDRANFVLKVTTRWDNSQWCTSFASLTLLWLLYINWLQILTSRKCLHCTDKIVSRKRKNWTFSRSCFFVVSLKSIRFQPAIPFTSKRPSASFKGSFKVLVLPASSTYRHVHPSCRIETYLAMHSCLPAVVSHPLDLRASVLRARTS